MTVLIDGELPFAPGVRMGDLDLDDPQALLDAVEADKGKSKAAIRRK